MSMQLEYNYAHITETGYCDSSMTFSYEINHPDWIAVESSLLNDYLYKYYNRANGLWYVDAEMTIEATELNNN